MAFARDGSYDQALSDFNAVVELYPDSDVADNALLEIAGHYLDVVRNVPAARGMAERIVNDARYSQGDAALGGYIVLGRTMMMAAGTADERENALANFQRGLRLHPGSEAVPEGMYHVATAYQRLDRLDEASEAYQGITGAYPRSVWAVRARLGSATSRALMGDPVGAMEEFQRVRRDFPDGEEAAEALAGTTILYRLHIRPDSAPYRVLVGADARRVSRDVIAMEIDASGNVVLATDRGVSSFTEGLDLPLVGRPRGLAVDQDGNVAVIARGRIERSGIPALALAVARDGRSRPLDEVDAAVELSNGDWLVADRDFDSVLRFRYGAYVGAYAAVRAERLAADREDRVAILDNDERIFVYADGRQAAQIPTRTSSYRIDNPVDVKFDVLGHLYVLDREGIYVFDRYHRLLTALTGDTHEAVPFERATALAVDKYGRLFVADSRDDRVYRLQ